MRIILRACASIICGQVSKRVSIRERELVILSSLVRVACITCMRFSLSIIFSPRSFFSFDRPQLSNNLTMSSKFFFYYRHNWVSILSSYSSSFFFISISSSMSSSVISVFLFLFVSLRFTIIINVMTRFP